jgi:hypothetical protein
VEIAGYPNIYAAKSKIAQEALSADHFRSGWKKGSLGKSGYFGPSRMGKVEEEKQADEEVNELKIELPTTETECWPEIVMLPLPRKIISFWVRCEGWVCVSEGGRLPIKWTIICMSIVVLK